MEAIYGTVRGLFEEDVFRRDDRRTRTRACARSLGTWVGLGPSYLCTYGAV